MVKSWQWASLQAFHFTAFRAATELQTVILWHLKHGSRGINSLSHWYATRNVQSKCPVMLHVTKKTFTDTLGINANEPHVFKTQSNCFLIDSIFIQCIALGWLLLIGHMITSNLQLQSKLKRNCEGKCGQKYLLVFVCFNGNYLDKPWTYMNLTSKRTARSPGVKRCFS